MVKVIFYGTLLSALVFLSVSFVSFIARSNSAELAGANSNKLEIGFPKAYLTQHWAEGSEKGTGAIVQYWNLKWLLASCFGYWVIICGAYSAYQYYQIQQARERRQRRRNRNQSSSSGSPVAA